MIPIAPIVMFVTHISGMTFVPFYDLDSCIKAREDLKKMDRSITTKCVPTSIITRKELELLKEGASQELQKK